jgi:hypothetical protein
VSAYREPDGANAELSHDLAVSEYTMCCGFRLRAG